MSGTARLRVVDCDTDRTVMVEPTSSEWEVDESTIQVLFWDNQEWSQIPPSARPKDAQRHRGKGWVLVVAV